MQFYCGEGGGGGGGGGERNGQTVGQQQNKYTLRQALFMLLEKQLQVGKLASHTPPQTFSEATQGHHYYFLQSLCTINFVPRITQT